jgi:CDP-paratose 2-epimerase
MQTARRLLITGGAGFIGANASHFFTRRGWEVTVLDNLSRPGTQHNLHWLYEECPGLSFIRGDVRDRAGIDRLMREGRFAAILHLAAQVAVTTSVREPLLDFEINAAGTFHVLDAARRYCPEAAFIFASTNKVYGNLESLPIAHRDGRYQAGSAAGVDEHTPLDFHSPYGCSKGAADQYVLDFARIYGMRTTVFRQSCIYGPRQFGIEDQGWVAWFAIAALLNRPLTLYGDGHQVRDVLHVADLLEAYEQAIANPAAAAGQSFNIGGGPANSISLLELVAVLEEMLGRRMSLRFADWRPGDQKAFVSNIDKAMTRLAWKPAIGWREGVGQLLGWIANNRELLDML